MILLISLSYFLGGVFFANALPHLLSGLMGKPFQSPFAKPRGEGLSSSTVNILWGFLNILIAYFLVLHVGNFHLRSIKDVLMFAIGAFLISLFLARHFGKFNGGNFPQ